MQAIDSRDIQTEEQVLDWAIHQAISIHFGQLDKGGVPYILHPLRVMMRMTTLQEKIVAVLHDVVEDGFYPVSDIREYAGKVIANAVDALSRRKGESYREFILRVKENDLARRVKIQDLLDNMDRSRIPNPSSTDEARWQKYEKALATLNAA